MEPFLENSIAEPKAYKLNNEFNTVSANDIDNILNSDRVQPRQVSTGVTRGTWRINNTDGSYITIGLIPNTDDEFGIAYFDANGDRLFTIDATGFLFSFNDERRMKLGLKPDNSDVGAYITPAGKDVIDELNS